MLDARAFARFRLPAILQGFPNVTYEPDPFRSFGSLGAFTPQDLHSGSVASAPGKRYAPTQNFVYYHSESVAIRIFRLMVVLNLRSQKLWAHPTGGTALSARVRRNRVRDSGETEIREAGVASLINQDIDLTGECR